MSAVRSDFRTAVVAGLVRGRGRVEESGGEWRRAAKGGAEIDWAPVR
jgi:hypothetical protein